MSNEDFNIEVITKMNIEYHKKKYEFNKNTHISVGALDSTIEQQIPYYTFLDMERNNYRKLLIDVNLDIGKRLSALKKYMNTCIEPKHWMIKFDNDTYVHITKAFQYICDSQDYIVLLYE